MLFCTTTCIRCVIRTGNSRRRRTASSSSSGGHPFASFDGQQVGGRDRVLHREVDADAADRRHRMRGVADAQQPRPRPALQPVDRDRQQLDVVPALHVSEPRFEDRRHPRDVVEQRRQSPRLHGVILPLGDDIGALPVVAAIERHHHLAGVDARKHALAFVAPLAGAKPQHVHRRADFLDREAGTFAHQRMAAVAGNREIGLDVDDAIRRLCLHARDRDRRHG